LIRCVYAAVAVAWEVSLKKNSVIDCCSIQFNGPYCVHWLFGCEVKETRKRDVIWLFFAARYKVKRLTLFKLSLRLHLSVIKLWRHFVFQMIIFLVLTRRVFRAKRYYGVMCYFFCLTKLYWNTGVNHNPTRCRKPKYVILLVLVIKPWKPAHVCTCWWLQSAMDSWQQEKLLIVHKVRQTLVVKWPTNASRN
jgi:hypothetical protein